MVYTTMAAKAREILMSQNIWRYYPEQSRYRGWYRIVQTDLHSLHANYGVSFTILWVTLHIQFALEHFQAPVKSTAISITKLKVNGSSLLELLALFQFPTFSLSPESALLVTLHSHSIDIGYCLAFAQYITHFCSIRIRILTEYGVE